jgi:hypothetical protein
MSQIIVRKLLIKNSLEKRYVKKFRAYYKNIII